MRLLWLLLLIVGPVASAAVYSLPEKGSLLGKASTYVVKKGQSFEEIARLKGEGPLNIIAANPGLDPLLPPAGSHIKLPSQLLLPNTPRQGIVINLAELRLYYYSPNGQEVYVFPVGIGRIGLDTPLGTTRIINKKANPTWTPTADTRKRLEEQGKTLPKVVPAGPNNPLGLFAMRLGFDKGEYLIHGTNEDVGIGMRVSAGCIRLEPKDIEDLFAKVPVHTPVRVINQPVKTAIEPDGKVYLEVHEPLSHPGRDRSLTMTKAQRALLAKPFINARKVQQAMLHQSGLPVLIGHQ